MSIIIIVICCILSSIMIINLHNHETTDLILGRRDRNIFLSNTEINMLTLFLVPDKVVLKIKSTSIPPSLPPKRKEREQDRPQVTF